MRHPFQRPSNDKNTVQTPFQRILVELIEGYRGQLGPMSGRKLSLALGKSANHVSLMLNDGFIPSGEAVMEMAHTLELDDATRDRLVRAVIETKASTRSRDAFWLQEALRLLDAAEGRSGGGSSTPQPRASKGAPRNRRTR